jgi:teichoic acid transport system ATP-binding protein
VVDLVPDLTPSTPRQVAPAQVMIDPSRVPTIVAQDVDITYRLHVALGRAQNPAVAVRRILSKRSVVPVREIHAVKKVSFVAYEGEAIGLIGSNGSGKSTLLRAIAGLMPPERGTLLIKGQPSLLGINAALLQDLSGERNVILGCLSMGMGLTETRERYQEVIDFSGIDRRDDFSSLPMRVYSSGMQSRLKFAIAAAKRHEILLIDEALSAGDAVFERKSQEKLRELRAAAGTVFLVSHSLSSVREMCERTLWLEAGDLRMDGPTEEVCTAYEEYTESQV